MQPTDADLLVSDDFALAGSSCSGSARLCVSICSESSGFETAEQHA